MVGARLVAADEGVEALDAMDQTVLQEKFQGPVDGGRRGAPAFALEHVEDVVGPHRFVTAPHQFQYPFAQLRKTDTAMATDFTSLRDRGLDAGFVVVRDFGKRWWKLNRCLH